MLSSFLSQAACISLATLSVSGMGGGITHEPNQRGMRAGKVTEHMRTKQSHHTPPAHLVSSRRKPTHRSVAPQFPARYTQHVPNPDVYQIPPDDGRGSGTPITYAKAEPACAQYDAVGHCVR
jgi:hypothetical protein